MTIDDKVLSDHLYVAITAAKAAGAQALCAGEVKRYTVQTKHTNDFVTDADKANEKLIIETIRSRFPEESFLGEESGESDGEKKGRWVIDPIDGTTNFFRGVPDYVISIAWEIEPHQPLVGVVYVPSQNELFTAMKGQGAFLNGRPIHVSSVTEHQKALVVCVPPHRHHEYADGYFQAERRIFDGCSDLRSFGSAALELCYIACGRLDGYYELLLGWWDIAAGTEILAEAGGICSCIGGPTDTRCDIIASNGSIQDWLREQVHG